MDLNTPKNPEFMCRMKGLARYFADNIKNNPLFTPEMEASREIYKILAENSILSENHLLDIVSAFNKVIGMDHYNGSGWLDFKLHLQKLFRDHGYNAVDCQDGKITISNPQ